MKYFKVPETSPLYALSCDLASQMVHSCKEESLEQYAKYYYNSLEELKEDNPEKYELFESVQKNGWKIYNGSADSCDQATLCEMDIDYEDDEIKIEKYGGY